MPEPSNYTRALLFDRLVDRRGEAGSRVLDREGLRESVQRELERLLNTRRSDRPADLHSAELTVVDYGIPDLAQTGPGNASDEVRLGEVIRRTIEAFEPRLQRVSVRVEKFRQEDRTLWARVDGILIVDGRPEPFTFRTSTGPSVES